MSDCESPIDLSKSNDSENDDHKRNDRKMRRTESVYSNKNSEIDSGYGSILSNNSGSDDETNNNNINDEKIDGSISEKLSDDKKTRNPMCARCRNHGEKVKVKGHKRKCPFKECKCEYCKLTEERRKLMAKTISVKRRQNEDMADNTYVPPEPVIKKSRAEENNYETGIESNRIITTSPIKYSSETAVKEVLETLVDNLIDRFGLLSIRELVNDINSRKHWRNSESNGVFSYLTKVLGEYQGKHGAFDIVNNHKTSNLKPTEITSMDHQFNGSNLRSGFHQNLQNQQLQQLCYEKYLQCYDKYPNSSVYPNRTNVVHQYPQLIHLSNPHIDPYYQHLPVISSFDSQQTHNNNHDVRTDLMNSLKKANNNGNSSLVKPSNAGIHFKKKELMNLNIG